jgi:hypothetical protein
MKPLGTCILTLAPAIASLPLTAHQSTTEHDIRAICEYLRAIPPATPGP